MAPALLQSALFNDKRNGQRDDEFDDDPDDEGSAAMRVKRSARVLASWLAMLAMLAAVLMPGLSHAFAAIDSAAYLSTDICRAGSAAAGDDGAPAPHEASLKHCPYCHHGNNLLLLPDAPSALAPAVADAPPTAPLADAPRPRSAWSAAQARGPPLF